MCKTYVKPYIINTTIITINDIGMVKKTEDKIQYTHSSRTDQASEITMTHQPYIIALHRLGSMY